MMTNKKVIVFDVDDTILTTQNRDYENSKPINEVIDGMRKLKADGWTIVLHTARGMGRSNGNIEKVCGQVRKEITSVCKKYNVPYDELILGKTWASFYVDDKAMLPKDFINNVDQLIESAK